MRLYHIRSSGSYFVVNGPGLPFHGHVVRGDAYDAEQICSAFNGVHQAGQRAKGDEIKRVLNIPC